MKALFEKGGFFGQGLSFLIVLMILLVMTGCGTNSEGSGNQAESSVTPLTSQELLTPGPYPVGTMKIRLVDHSRPTDPNGSYPGAPSRTLNTHVWYPAEIEPSPSAPFQGPVAAAENGPFPLIVHSHGFMSWGTECRFLAEHLAGHGYIVISPTYPLTWMLAPGGLKIDDVVNQPGDVSFLIDSFLAFHQDRESPFFGVVDASRIGVAGLSLGGMTTSLVTYHPYLRDPRIAAAATLAGPGSMFTEVFYGNSRAPLLVIHGDIDAIVDYETNALLTLEMAAAKVTLATFLGATHTGFSNVARIFMESVDNPDSVGCAALTSGPPLDEVDFPALLGGEEAGIVQRETPYPCLVSPLPRSLRPSRQQTLTLLGVLSFFESRFSSDPRMRKRASRFLHETIMEENQEVTIR